MARRASPMKILAVLTFYHPHWTGLTAHAQQLAEGLARRGHAVTVLAYRHAAELSAEEWLNGVRVVRVASLARLSRGMVGPAYLAAAASWDPLESTCRHASLSIL